MADETPKTGRDADADDAGPAWAFRRGFLAMVPLWAGAIPVGAAYGAAARDAGLGFVETQSMSLVVFSAAAQLAALASFASKEPALLVVATALALNVQLLLVGAAVSRAARLPWRSRVTTAWFLTEGAFAVASAAGPKRPEALIGAGVGMYLAWNAGTAAGALGGGALTSGDALGLDLLAPLTFLAVLVPPLRSRPAALAALVAAGAVLVLALAVPRGGAILGADAAGGAAGAWAARAAADREPGAAEEDRR